MRGMIAVEDVIAALPKKRQDAITVRCLQRGDGSMPASDAEAGLVCIVSKSY